jgi:ADP-ribose pyrophosphatase
MPRFAKSPSGPIADGPAAVTVSPPEVLARGFRPYNRFRFTFLDREGDPQTRDILSSGASVAVLLLQQFRLPAHLANANGCLFEIVAGHVEGNDSALATARRECAEEIGVAPDPLIELLTYLTTPGFCDEQITLFLGIVDASRIPERAGLAAEHEETFLVRLPIDDALAALARGALHSGPLVLGLYWLALNLARLDEIVRTGTAKA